MKKLVAFLITLALLCGMLAVVPISAVSAEETLDSHLITHWDFAGNDVMADKATAGTVSDTLQKPDNTGRRQISNGILTIQNGSAVSYLYCEDSSDLLRTADSRSVFVKFRTDTVDQLLELLSQNSALRLFHGANSGTINASTSPEAMGTNALWTKSSEIKADTWYTIAVCYEKNGSAVKLSIHLLTEGAGWTTISTSYVIDPTYWTTDSSANVAGAKNGKDSLYIGRRYNGGGADIAKLEIDDIRIYDKALTLEEAQSIEVTNPSADVFSKGHSLTLSGELGVNFYLGAKGYLANNDVNVTITRGEQELLNVNTRLSAENQCTELPGAYKFTAHIAAKEMIDKLTMTVKSGETVLYTEEYSAKAYADQAIANADGSLSAETVALVKAMLNYGGYAQQYFGYATDDLANAGLNLALPEIQRDTAAYPCTVTGSVTGISDAGATLRLDTRTHIVFSITLADGANAADYQFEGGSVEVNGNNVTVTTDGIYAQSLTENKNLTVKCGDEVLTVSYSPMTYIMNQLEHENADLVALLRALYAYHTAAVAYVEAN